MIYQSSPTLIFIVYFGSKKRPHYFDPAYIVVLYFIDLLFAFSFQHAQIVL